MSAWGGVCPTSLLDRFSRLGGTLPVGQIQAGRSLYQGLQHTSQSQALESITPEVGVARAGTTGWGVGARTKKNDHECEFSDSFYVSVRRPPTLIAIGTWEKLYSSGIVDAGESTSNTADN